MAIDVFGNHTGSEAPLLRAAWCCSIGAERPVIEMPIIGSCQRADTWKRTKRIVQPFESRHASSIR